jgi:hypothetical protein
MNVSPEETHYPVGPNRWIHKRPFSPGYSSVHQVEAFLPPHCIPTTSLHNASLFPPELDVCSELRWFLGRQDSGDWGAMEPLIWGGWFHCFKGTRIMPYSQTNIPKDICTSLHWTQSVTSFDIVIWLYFHSCSYFLRPWSNFSQSSDYWDANRLSNFKQATENPRR